MKKYIILISLIVAILSVTGCQGDVIDDKTVAVSIVPQETFVKKVAGDLIDVVVMIPPGYNPANYQPTPQEMAKFNEAALYFYIDVSAEAHILESVDGDMKLVDIAASVDELYPARYFEEDSHDEEAHDEESHDEDSHEDEHNHEGRDPHIWLSPKRTIVMIEVIREELTLLDPENEAIYAENAQAYIEELQALDASLLEIFDGINEKSFIMYHPSFGYFAEDYGLEMHAIEASGKKATIQELEHVIEVAKDENIKYIFYQEEFDSQQAEIVAKEIGGQTIKVAPLSGDYVDNLKSIAQAMDQIMN